MKITDLPGFSGIPSQPKVPSSVKSQIANELVNMCARDIRPFSTVDGEGFQGLCKSLIAIGSKYGNVPIEQVLPCATTVSRHMESVLAKEKAALCEVLKTAVNFGITTDGWSHTSTNQQYITITIHFIDEQWKMHSHILATRDADEKHTADYIKQLVRSVMNEFAVYRPGIVFVTDNAANMKAAFRDELWIGCAGHNLNLVLSHGLQNSSIQSTAAVTELPTEVTGLIATCKELVTLVKRTKLNNSLDTTLKQCIQTRWNSVLRTLQSVYDSTTIEHSYDLQHQSQIPTETFFAFSQTCLMNYWSRSLKFSNHLTRRHECCLLTRHHHCISWYQLSTHCIVTSQPVELITP